MSLWAHCRSAASLLVITLNLSICAPLLLIAGLVKWAVPGLRPFVNRGMAAIYRWAVRVDDFWLRRVVGIKWDRPELNLRRDRSYLVLANHSSWSDILMIQSVIVRQGPLLKFLVKRELAFIPLLGLIFWAYDFPLLRRSSRAGEDDVTRRQRDLDAVREACGIVRENPAAVMTFAEGSRSTPEKRVAQQSPYQHLLKPRVGGFFALLEALEEGASGVVDLTLGYPESVSFWRFLSGEVPRVTVAATFYEPECLPQSREAASDWLAERWAEKDARIAKIRAGSEENPIPD